MFECRNSIRLSDTSELTPKKFAIRKKLKMEGVTTLSPAWFRGYEHATHAVVYVPLTNTEILSAHILTLWTRFKSQMKKSPLDKNRMTI